jgi:hypothetical protein
MHLRIPRYGLHNPQDRRENPAEAVQTRLPPSPQTPTSQSGRSKQSRQPQCCRSVEAVDPNAAADPNEVADPNEAEDPNEVEDPNEIEDPAEEIEVEAPLIGDIKDGGTTPIGQVIARIITAQEPGQSSVGGYRIPGQLGSAKCKADTCCVWSFVSMQLTNVFRGQSGRCNKYARAAIRLGFHDAGTWEEGLDYGGADGSIILAKEEMARPDNRGLQDIVRVLGNLHRQTFKQHGVGMADLIQFAAKHAVVSTYPPLLSKQTNKQLTHSLPQPAP